jgi:integrase
MKCTRQRCHVATLSTAAMACFTPSCASEITSRTPVRPRFGEMMALEWSDVDLHKRQLTVQHSEWKGHLTATKGGRLRHVPMTERLVAALKAHRHLRGSRVLVQSNGEALTMKVVQDRVASAARRAGVRPGVHILRHTFCSHLAMRGAPARAIQELAGHQDLKTTQRYMHLSPAAVEGAIRLLDSGRTALDSRWRESEVGNMLATGSTEIGNSSQ